MSNKLLRKYAKLLIEYYTILGDVDEFGSIEIEYFIEMRVRKLAGQKTKSGQMGQSQINPVVLMQTRLCKKYNHSDKHFYLKSIEWAEKSN